MDELDDVWLSKNNQEARGEGTSTQAAVSSPGTSTRHSQRSAKARGKEPEVQSAMLLTEDQFELVMGLFEKWTQDKAEFLHHVSPSSRPHGPENGIDADGLS
jgi:enhancer of polycomb-like protein